MKRGFPDCSDVKKPPAMQEMQVQSLVQEDPLEKEMAIHFSILAPKIPWTEESVGLQPKGLQKVRHNWVAGHTHDVKMLQVYLQFWGFDLSPLKVCKDLRGALYYSFPHIFLSVFWPGKYSAARGPQIYSPNTGLVLPIFAACLAPEIIWVWNEICFSPLIWQKRKLKPDRLRDLPKSW